MPLHFSPVDQSELINAFVPRPRAAFVMLQLSPDRSDAEGEMEGEVRAALGRAGFTAITASEVQGTGDYLNKIVDLIRGCGFGIAIFSDKTPANTLGNIFFEIGVAAVLGKPIQLVVHNHKGKRITAPSDFVRSEWIAYQAGEQERLGRDLDGSLRTIADAAVFYRTIGELALNAPMADMELAFERFKQAVLITDDQPSRRAITQICNKLIDVITREGNDDMSSHRMRLHKAASEFMGLLPRH